jgi:acetyltransferase-like isoleucine patch superfamily enzyme
MGLIKKLWLWIISTIDGCCNGLMLRYKRVECEETPTIYGRLRIYGGGPIQMGKGVVINSCESANPIGGDTKTIFSLAHGGALQIGNNVGMSCTAISCKNSITICDHAMLGGGVKIMDSDSHSLSHEKRAQGYPVDVPVSKPVRIGEHAFIGANITILKGVTIGPKAVIGTGSVVTKDVPAGEIWAGNPARFIRKV